jgi:Protein of unknown function (DUF1488)
VSRTKEEAGVPLDRAIGEPVEHPDGSVQFRMFGSAGFVPCRVTADALRQLSGERYRTPLQAFEAMRGHLELIASEKYDSGHIDDDGGITIKQTDVAAAD